MISAFIFAAALVFSQDDAKAVLNLTDSFVRERTCRDAGTFYGSEAAKWLHGKAAIHGGNVYRDQFEAVTPKGKRIFTNLYCPFERDSRSPWTVLVSHFDTKPGSDCPGANDGAVTSCLLVQFCKILFENRDFDRNVMLIWTDGEECAGFRYTDNDGFQGSKRAAKMLCDKKYDVDAIYVLDMLGDRDLKIMIPPNVSKDLARRVVYAARDIGLTRKQLGLLDQQVLDDHVSFKEAGFKSIDLIDFEYGSKPGLNDYWHSSEDTVDKLSVESIDIVGRLVCRLLSAAQQEAEKSE